MHLFQVVCWLVLTTLTTLTFAQESPQEVEIIKQINRVNDDGSYTFGYEAADGSFKIETRDVLGNVKGMFGFVDENGELKRVSYNANNGTGFRASPNLGDRPLGLSAYTTSPPEADVTRRPALVLTQPSDSTRAPVIQHIPRRGLGSRVTSTTTPVYGEYVRNRRPHVVLPSRSQEEVSSTTPKVTEAPEETNSPTHIPLGRIVVTKRPATGKGGNHLRRQLTNEPESTAGDVADVYTGGAAVPRYVPAQSIRSPQSSLLANLPPHVAAALRQQQLTRAAAAASRPYPTDLDSYPVPIPSPRPAVIDEQEYPPPIRARASGIPLLRPPYRPVDEDDGPTQIPFPMASLRSLRDELMDYIYQYLQYRLGGGNPYIGNPYPPPYQNPYVNPNLPYPAPPNFGGGNPNVYNPYPYPNLPFGRNPYQPPFGPLPYPQGPYPPIYPGQNFPQPLPFNSPNKQLAAQQYSPNVRSAPKYEPYTPSQRLTPERYNPQSINPAAFESQRYQDLLQRTASSYDQADSKGTADTNTYSLPPADVLRMMLARGLPGVASTTSTTTRAPPTFIPTLGPVRNVKIIGASSSVSSTTVKPPTRTVRENPTTEPTDEMEMQA